MPLTPVVPFEPVVASAIPDGDNWIAQIKWDGVRVLTYCEGRETRLFNRKRNERTMQYPELQDAAQYCGAQSVILDGEVIALENGKPSFHQVMRRDGIRNLANVRPTMDQVPILYMVFDVLYCDGRWVTDQPLAERQALLRSIVSPNKVVQLVGNEPDAEGLFRVTGMHGLEGIVYKDLQSAYAVNGKDERWRKRKHVKDLVAAVGGVTFRGDLVNALLLGLYDAEGNLYYVGHAGAGKMTANDWRSITEVSGKLRIPAKPFVNKPDASRANVWLNPLLTVKVNYLEWTADGVLRQPVLQGFVSAAAEECKLEQLLR